MPSETFICPDCGIQQQKPAWDSYCICTACFAKATGSTDGNTEVRFTSLRKGRGVYALKDFEAGDLIERCHVIPMAEDESVILPTTVPTLNRYLFPWPTKKKAIMTGNGLLYNNSPNHPNVMAVLCTGILMAEFRALKRIQAGEELVYNYVDIRIRRSGTGVR